MEVVVEDGIIKEFRRKMISSVKDFRIAEKTAASEKFISAADFDSSIFTSLFNTSDRLTLEIADVQKTTGLTSEAIKELRKCMQYL